MTGRPPIRRTAHRRGTGERRRPAAAFRRRGASAVPAAAAALVAWLCLQLPGRASALQETYLARDGCPCQQVEPPGCATIVFDPLEDAGEPDEDGTCGTSGISLFGGNFGGGGCGLDDDVTDCENTTRSIVTGWGGPEIGKGEWGVLEKTLTTNFKAGDFSGWVDLNEMGLDNSFFSFWINPEAGPTEFDGKDFPPEKFTIEVNIQEGTGFETKPFPDGSDEFQFNCIVAESDAEPGDPGAPCAFAGRGWQLVRIPITDFFKDNSTTAFGNGVINNPIGRLVFVIIQQFGDPLDQTLVCFDDNRVFPNEEDPSGDSKCRPINFKIDHWAFTNCSCVDPTDSPTLSPTNKPTTASPTASPTAGPTASPTASPTAVPTAAPTASPTAVPTAGPTAALTASPITKPTTAAPTASPITKPTTAAPTESPTSKPTTAAPTASPITKPTTASPTESARPTRSPSARDCVTLATECRVPVVPAEPPRQACADGKKPKPNKLTLRYVKGSCGNSDTSQKRGKKWRCDDLVPGGATLDEVHIMVIDKQMNTLFSDTVTEGETYEVIANMDGVSSSKQKKGKGKGKSKSKKGFGSEISVLLSNSISTSAPLQAHTIHTSCSAPLKPGDRFGATMLVEALSGSFDASRTDCGSIPLISDRSFSKEDTPLHKLRFRYLEEGCQDVLPEKAGCKDLAPLVSPVKILATDSEKTKKSDPSGYKKTKKGGSSDSKKKEKGDSLTVDKAEVNKHDTFTLVSEDGLGKEIEIEIRSLQGDALLQKLVIHTSGSAPLLVKVGSLELFEVESMSGQKKSALVNVELEHTIANPNDDPIGVSLVKRQLSQPCAGISEQLNVAMDIVVPSNGKEKLIDTAIVDTIRGGDVEVRTTAVLTDGITCEATDVDVFRIGVQPSLVAGCTKGQKKKKPIKMTLQYLREDCSHSENSQESSKWYCEDIEDDLPAVARIKVEYKKGEDIFMGVAKDGTFVVDSKGKDLGPNLFLTVLDDEGKKIQEVRIHISCSTTLSIGNQFGAFEVTSWDTEKGQMIGGMTSPACFE